MKLAECLQHPIGMFGLQVGKFHVDAGNNSLVHLVSHMGGIPAAKFNLQETLHIKGLKHTSAASWDMQCPDVGILECLHLTCA